MESLTDQELQELTKPEMTYTNPEDVEEVEIITTTDRPVTDIIEQPPIIIQTDSGGFGRTGSVKHTIPALGISTFSDRREILVDGQYAPAPPDAEDDSSYINCRCCTGEYRYCSLFGCHYAQKSLDVLRCRSDGCNILLLPLYFVLFMPVWVASLLWELGRLVVWAVTLGHRGTRCWGCTYQTRKVRLWSDDKYGWRYGMVTRDWREPKDECWRSCPRDWWSATDTPFLPDNPPILKVVKVDFHPEGKG